ncbi:sulfurtransferase-like selenium metabolism protein YedF [Facklamia sp. DSM 111018]|uniref:Sulfurtransferase-like selenium metabolism protein YedF n=1 Tax=Facklamia lactis TaxID=2749967 RepID=A0ABS0LS23_9LACT|nr:sulfurtransferase-like selenium metabolism protein YedF [Facklamia lactis]MBG9981165.1 sulfurtransferase-like selenium metabolism protein YedF [Facklamia lactis]MBG9986966.1 sulfurtransferase-like selenium metabolism protein YedF [Facklamia lactis]
MANSYDVIIRSTGMGAGEQPLTENLMKGFLNTLANTEKAPKHVVLYGEAVKLSCKGSDSIEDLKALEEKGAKILSCGICTDYYEIENHIMVGGTTTMREVVDIMTESELLIEP